MAESSSSSEPSASKSSLTRSDEGAMQNSSRVLVPSSLSLCITVDWTYSCTASPRSGTSSSGDHRRRARGCPPSACATLSAVALSVSLGSSDLACSSASPSSLNSVKPSGSPNGLGDLEITSREEFPPDASSSNCATPLVWRECSSWASSRTSRVRGPSQAPTIADGDEGAPSPSHIPPITAASVSESHGAQRTVHPMLKTCSATARARLDLPTPGRPLRSTFEPASRESDRLVESSSLPCREIWSGMGPNALPLRAPEGSSSSATVSRPDSVMCTTVRRREPPPMTCAVRVRT